MCTFLDKMFWLSHLKVDLIVFLTFEFFSVTLKFFHDTEIFLKLCRCKILPKLKVSQATTKFHKIFCSSSMSQSFTKISKVLITQNRNKF